MKHQEFIRHPAVKIQRPSWVVVNAPVINPTGFKDARDWQRKAFIKLSAERLKSIFAPPSTGKGVIICMLATQHLTINPYSKVIIAVPQKIISADLKEQKFVLPSNQQEIRWAPMYLNDSRDNIQANVDVVNNFLNRPSVNGNIEISIQNNVCVMTHATLVNAFTTYPELFKNLLLFVDEHHHIQYDESEDGNITETNGLGDLVKHILENYSTNNISLCLTTATAFRGDRKAIIPAKFESLFVDYEHPYDEAWTDFAPLTSFGVDFVLYKNAGYRKTLQHLLGPTIEPCIIYVPNVNSQYSVGHKHDDVKECYKAIAGTTSIKLKYLNLNNEPTTEETAVITLVKKGETWVRCVNLVDERNRSQKSEVIYTDHKSNTRNIDVILTLGMLKEGANWKWAKNEYIIGNRNSFREFVQMVGRLFRVCDGKTEVMSYYLLPYSRNRNDDEYLENFNDYSKALLSSLLLIKIFYPKLIDTQVEDPNAEPDERGERIKRISYINEVFGDDYDKIQRLKDNAVDAMIKASHDHGIEINIKKGNVDITPEQRQILSDSMNAVLDDLQVTAHREEIKEELFRWFAIENALLDMTGMKVNELTFDVVSKSTVHPCKFMLTYTSGLLGADTFSEYRKVVDRHEARWNEYLEWAKKNEDKLRKEFGILE